MPDAIPGQALGPANQPWRQWVETQISGVLSAVDRLGSNVANAVSSLNGSFGLLSAQVQTIANTSVMSKGSSAPGVATGTGTNVGPAYPYWYPSPAMADPSITFVAAYSSALIQFGGVLSNNSGASTPQLTALGLRSNGAILDKDTYEAVSSDQPTSGGQPVSVAGTYLMDTVPGQTYKIELAYGAYNFGTAPTPGNTVFGKRFLIITPIAD